MAKQRSGQVEIRTASREDLAAFSDKSKGPTAKAGVAEIDGKTVALGGLAFFMGRWVGFLDINQEGRDYLAKNLFVKVAMIRAVRTKLSEARRDGVRFIYAEPDADIPRAPEFLSAQGFSAVPLSHNLYRWRA